MGVPITSPQQRGYRALIAFGLNDGQILDLVDLLKDQGVEFREVEKEATAELQNTGPIAEPWTPHNADFQFKAKTIVQNYYNAAAANMGDPEITLGDVYVVWFCKTLQNWKCLLSTSVPDQMYYEVTYDGDKKQAYLDAYKKVINITVQDLPARVQSGSTR